MPFFTTEMDKGIVSDSEAKMKQMELAQYPEQLKAVNEQRRAQAAMQQAQALEHQQKMQALMKASGEDDRVQQISQEYAKNPENTKKSIADMYSDLAKLTMGTSQESSSKFAKLSELATQKDSVAANNAEKIKEASYDRHFQNLRVVTPETLPDFAMSLAQDKSVDPLIVKGLINAVNKLGPEKGLEYFKERMAPLEARIEERKQAGMEARISQGWTKIEDQKKRTELMGERINNAIRTGLASTNNRDMRATAGLITDAHNEVRVVQADIAARERELLSIKEMKTPIEGGKEGRQAAIQQAQAQIDDLKASRSTLQQKIQKYESVFQKEIEKKTTPSAAKAEMDSSTYTPQQQAWIKQTAKANNMSEADVIAQLKQQKK